MKTRTLTNVLVTGKYLWHSSATQSNVLSWTCLRDVLVAAHGAEVGTVDVAPIVRDRQIRGLHPYRKRDPVATGCRFDRIQTHRDEKHFGCASRTAALPPGDRGHAARC